MTSVLAAAKSSWATDVFTLVTGLGTYVNREVLIAMDIV